MRGIPRIRPSSGLPRYCSAARQTTTAPFSATNCYHASPARSTTSRQAAPSAVRFYSTPKNESAPQSTPEHELKETPASLAAPEEVEPVYQELEEADDSYLAYEDLPQTYKTPPQRSFAEPEAEVSDPDYVPASTMEGLESVGGLQNWWDRRENFGKDYAGFKPKGKVLKPLVLTAAVRRAVVEAYAMRQSGQSDEDLVRTWALPVDPIGPWSSVKLAVSEDGTGVTLEGEVNNVAKRLRVSEGETKGTIGKRNIMQDSSKSFVSKWEGNWMAAPLTDLKIKFAVTKRIFQLTGNLVPDSKFEEIKTVGDLLEVVLTPPKPKQLIEEIEQLEKAREGPGLTNLANVRLHPKRVTRGDKDKMLGRMKLMEEEFRKRGLPVKGHGWALKSKELKHLQGEA